MDAGFTGPVLRRSSKSSTVAISEDDQHVVMVNPERDSVSVFRTSDDTRTAIVELTAGDEPSAVVIAPDNDTVYVALRGAAAVAKLTGLSSGTPTVASRLPVGSEPTGVALSPSGLVLYVAEFAESAVSVVDTPGNMTVRQVLPGIRNPRALAVTNDGDLEDGDEHLIIPEFFGVPASTVPASLAELDLSRTGKVRVVETGGHTFQDSFDIVPVNSGIQPTGTSAGSVSTAPNQLFAIAIRAGRIYLPSISASPAPPARFDGNVYPVVYVGEIASRSFTPSGATTVNLAQKILDAPESPAGAAKFFLADIVDIAFLPGTAGAEPGVSYVISRGADVMQRVVFDDAASSVTVGSSKNLQVDVNGGGGLYTGCKGPSGIVLDSGGGKAYLNCSHSHTLGVVGLGSAQELLKGVEAYPALVSQQQTDKGRRFFFTGRARWSGNASSDAAGSPPTQNGLAWSSCGSCHPDGLSDNITWAFAAGPRQTTSMDGSWSHTPGQPQVQRIFNWTGIFDELHDFERNTRGVSGGLGAVTTGTCGTLSAENRKALGGGLAQPVREVQNEGGSPSCTTDWDDMEAWAMTIRPPRGLKRLDAALVAQGAAIFGAGTSTDRAGCVSCHGGNGWTASRLFWTPSTVNNTALTTAPFTKPSAWPASWNSHTTHIANEPGSGGAVAPTQVACGLRHVGTFTASTFERKPDTTSVAQGERGFNIPSLYGMQLGAPYLHHGLAESLEALLSPSGPFVDHLRAGNDNFAASAQQVEALVAYVRSIDATTPVQPIPAGLDGCPASFP